MKKIYTILFTVLAIFSINTAFAYTQPIISGGGCDYPCTPSYGNTGGYIELFNGSGNPVYEGYGDGGSVPSIGRGIGTWYLVTYSNPSFCWNSTFLECTTNYPTALWVSYQIIDPATKGTIDNLIKNATSTFNNTIGFTPANAVFSVSDIFIKPIIGGGISLLYELRFWTIALVVLSAIIYFAFRAFRFYKH